MKYQGETRSLQTASRTTQSHVSGIGETHPVPSRKGPAVPRDSDAHRSTKMATLECWEKTRFREGFAELAPLGLSAAQAEPAPPGTRPRHRHPHMNRPPSHPKPTP